MQQDEVVAVGAATIRSPQRIMTDRAFCVFDVRIVMSGGQIGFQPDRIAFIAHHESMR